MVRAFQLAVCAVVLCAAATAEAGARCDTDEGVSLLPELLRTPLPDVRPADDEPRPPDARVCVPGATDDPSCRPFSSLPAPGQTAFSIFSATFLVGRAPGLPPVCARRLPRITDGRLVLAPGFARRLERPPRSFSFVA